MKVEKDFDHLFVHWRSDKLDIGLLDSGDEIDVIGGTDDSYIEWTSDYIISEQGFTLLYYPKFPKISIPMNTTYPND